MMNISPTNAPSVVVARPRVGFFAYATWPMHAVTGCTDHMAVNQGDSTGITESKRLTPGDLTGDLT